jgi:malate/lactate dehydrogenase
MRHAGGELRVAPVRLIGAAPLALESALRALCAVVADASGAEVSLAVVGVPPGHAVVAWEEATLSGQPLASVIGAHEIASLSSRIPSLWPPGPYALGSAAARIVEGIVSSSRRRFSCFVDAGRGKIVAMPVELEPRGVKRVIEPTLTRLERTALDNALEA